jgi:hypothetical protein
MEQKVYYDYIDGVQVPVWMVISVNSYEINWDRESFFVPIETPFEVFPAEDFTDSEYTYSIRMDEILLNPLHYPGQIGLNLKAIRTMARMIDCDEIKNFVISFWDMEEILNLDACRQLKNALKPLVGSH